MARISYPARKHGITVGVPFTWGAGVYWYIKTDRGSLVCLNDGMVLPDPDEQGVLDDSDFHYATSMELK